MVKALCISAAFVMPIALVWMLLPPPTVTSTRPAHPPAPRVVAPRDLSGSAAAFDLQDSDGKVDLHGNEVSEAVAKYRTDTAGALYELHSPNTELPKLGSPKT